MRIFLKQYGAQRTGTNYLRTLIRRNYADVEPLMHVLGDKHSPPAPFDALWREAQDHPDPSLEFVRSATHLRPALTTKPANLEQQAEIRRVAEPLAAAYVAGSLGFLVSIKDPYAWAVSLAVYEGWGARQQRMAPSMADRIADRCRSFNERYRAWLELAAQHPSRTHIVRYDDLLDDPERVLDSIDAKFGLQRSAAFVNETGRVQPPVWDESTGKIGAKFDPSYYVEKRFLTQLSPPVLEAITNTIDWELMRSFDYFPPG